MSEHFPALRLALLALCALVATGCTQSLGLQGADLDEGTDELDRASPTSNPDGDEPSATQDEQDSTPTEPEPLSQTHCLLGEDVAAWAWDDTIGLGEFETVLNDDDLSELEADQIADGLNLYEWFDFDDLRHLFSTLDGERVMLRDVDIAGVHESFTHIRFHFRGFEFGLVYATDSMRVVAGVEQGKVVGCELLAE